MSSAGSFAPLDAATGQPVNLAMQRLWLTGQILPAGARVVVRHVFRSEEEKALEVIYAFPLPRDGALRSFRITGEGFEAHSELKRTEKAVADYEEGIEEGSLSALVRQYGDSLVNLTVGNIRPHETVTVYLEILCGVELNDSGFRFRFPFTLAPCYHSRARTAVTEPGEGEMELPADQFGDVILPRFSEDAAGLHQVGFELTTVGQLDIDEIGSPSHAIRVRHGDGHSARIALAIENDVPNRDLVLDVAYQTIGPQVLAGNGHFAAIVPSACFGVSTETSRRVVILLDRSGSMKGSPLRQASKAIDACLGALSETDHFGLVTFGSEVQTFCQELAPGTREMRDLAHQFLSKVQAGGGTELRLGLLEASRLLGGVGDVFVVTDGQVFGTEEVLEVARSTGIRLHCLGIGDASQDRFLALLARETGGVSRFVTPSERVDLPAVDLFASMGRPVASGLTVSGNIQPEPPAFVFSGTPILLFGSVDGGSIQLTWSSGRLNLPIVSSKVDVGETVWLLQGSRLITDCEADYPYTLTLDTAFSDYFGGPIGLARPRAGSMFTAPSHWPQLGECCLPDIELDAEGGWGASMPAPSNTAAVDILLDLASRIEADGGMPGLDQDSRAIATIVALLAFLSNGHTATEGAFRSHVAKLVQFLRSLTGLSSHNQRIVAAVILQAKSADAPEGDWINLDGTAGDHWDRVENAVLRSEPTILSSLVN